MRPTTDREPKLDESLASDDRRPLAKADDRNTAEPGTRALHAPSLDRSTLGRFVMPRDGRRVTALVARMRDRSRVTIIARRAIVPAGALWFAIVARGQA